MPTTITGTETLFFDAQGRVLRNEVVSVRLRGRRNPASGKSVIERDHVHNVFYEDGTVAIMGLNFHLSLPHGRTVLIDAGKLRFDTDGDISFEAGNHQVADGAYSGLGSALA